MRAKDLIPIATFFAGAATGAWTAWELLKDTYEEKTRVEIESVRKAYESLSKNAQNEEKKEEPKPVAEEVKTTRDLLSYAQKIIEEKKYTPDIPNIPKHDGPYVISPDEYGEMYDYSRVNIIYFADGALSDNEYDILTNSEVEESFGYECLDHFGEYENDTVYVRNDAKKCDYEIQKDLRNYSELDMGDL